MDVPVIRDVQQQLGTRSLLNPAVKYRNQRLEPGFSGFFDEQFYVYVLKFMAAILQAPSADRRAHPRCSSCGRPR